MDNGARSYRRFREEGDEAGLAELIHDYKDGLILYLNSLVGNLYDAEDLAEDTFVLLATKRPRDKGKSSFKTWLYTIARNLAIDHLRRRARRPICPLEDGLQMAVDTNDLAHTYLRQERKASLHSAMGTLKSDYRQVLWLLYFEELSYREAANILRRSVHSVETLAYRARQALRAELEKEGFTYEDL